MDELGGKRSHAFLGLEPGMEEPETGHFCSLSWEFSKAIDKSFETRNTVFNF